jgi:hypothetical protein
MPRVYLDTGRVVEKKKYDSLYVENIFIQVYINLADVFMKIHSPTAYKLLMWIMVHMGRHNEIILNKGNRHEFIAFSVHRGGVRVADATVKGAIRELTYVGIIVSTSDVGKRESHYMLNPNYFWSTGNQKDRLEAIKAYLHFKEINDEKN